MKIKLFFFAAVVFIMASCSQNEFDKPKVKRFLHATASVVEPTETRATLVQYVNLPYKSLRYVWEVGDVIYFCFEQNGARLTNSTTVTSVANGGSTAVFTIPFPEELADEDFKIYAYRSGATGAGFQTNSPIAILPTNPYNYPATLDDQADRLSMYSVQDVTYSGGEFPAISLAFQHMGSVMTVHLKNIGSDAITDIIQLGLRSAEGTSWLRNVGTGGATFNLITDNFDIPIEGNTLIFYSPTNDYTINGSGGERIFHTWFVPGPYTTGNNITLGTLNGTALTDLTSLTAGVKNAINFEKGKNYVLYAHIDKVQSTVGGATYDYTITYKTSGTY